jgi:hypothetical protein
LGCGLGVEAQAWSWPVAECDRAELVGVFVDPCAGGAELAGELARIEQVSGRVRRGGVLGLVLA